VLIDCGQTPQPPRIETDVAIIGSGAAGLSLALALDMHGVSTVLLEAGGDRFDRTTQDFYRATRIEPESHGPVHLYRRRAFGGTTAIWGGRCIPFDPIDFEHRSWIPHARWPIGYEAVAAYYPRAMELCRAGTANFDAKSAQLGSPGPIVDGVDSPDVILDRIERFSEPTHFGRFYRKRLEASAHVKVLLRASVTEIRTNAETTNCLGVTAHVPGGGKVEIDARRTVVAAGGLETPRLLLASSRSRACGLGNERDLVGRFYQAHLEGEVGTIEFRRPPLEVRLDYQRSPDGIYCRRYIWLSPEAQRREALGGLIVRPGHANIVDPAHLDPVLSAMYLVKGFILPEYSRKLTSTERRVQAQFRGRNVSLLAAHLANVIRHPIRLFEFSTAWARRRILASRKLPSVVLRDPRNRYPLDVNAEQSPNPDSRVRLSTERDSMGLPRLEILWQMTAEDRARVARGMRVLQTAFTAAESAQIELAELEQQVGEITRIGGHHIGTARMADSPQTGVTDHNGAVFGTDRLFVSGAALFPTSGFANPTLTIVALALRLGDHLANNKG
jgi:choline dehydrogenase-like flavoprotein